MTDSPSRSRWQRLTYRGPPVDTLRGYAREGRIDTEAPVTAYHQVIIAAPIKRVWEILSDPTRWESIHHSVHNVRLDRGVAEGTRFTWRYGRARLASTITVVDGGSELTWISTSKGARSVHRHELSIAGDGQTRLFSEASMTGLLLVMFFDQAKLRSAIESWLTAIATAAVTETTNDFMSPSDWLADSEEAESVRNLV